MKFNQLKLFLLLCTILQNIVLFGQVPDTNIVLNPVNISANKVKYLVGSKITNIDSVKLLYNSSGSLTDILNTYFSIYVKENAGGLATIKFRGASADHTSILFNGININSLTLGHSNISQISTFLFDDIKIQYGSSGSLYGTDAIGGSIHLNNKIKWNNGFKLGFEQEIASFNSYFSGINTKYSDSKLSFNTKAFYFQKENNFPFTNLAVKDYNTGEFIHDTLKNSAIRNYGILQELNLKLSDKLIVYSKLWYNNSWYEAQPNMSENYYGGDFAEILNKNLRVLTGFKYYNGVHKLTTGFAYLYDYQLYNKNVEQLISTKSFISNINYFHSNLWSGDFNIGAKYQRISPDVYAYKESNGENRFDLFSSYKKILFQKLTTAVNLRESIVLGYKNRFAPSLGLDYSIIENNNQNLNLKLSYAHSYKIPTFNQRFWYPNGNPDILAETGVNYEIGTTYKYSENNHSFSIDVTGYLMDIDNWIQWVKEDIWRPVNTKKVRNSGVELSLNFIFSVSSVSVNSGFNYSFSNAIEVKSYSNHSISGGKQLIYTPQHIGKAYIDLFFNRWHLQTTGSYTGKRYTEQYKTLPGYFLLNAHLGREFVFKKHQFNINFSIKNVFNKSYQNWKYYAMPGRNYALNIKCFLK